MPHIIRCGPHCHRMVVEVKIINVLKRGRTNSEKSLSEAGQHRLWMQFLPWGAPKLQSPSSWGSMAGLPCCQCSVCLQQATINTGIVGFRDYTSEYIQLNGLHHLASFQQLQVTASLQLLFFFFSLTHILFSYYPQKVTLSFSKLGRYIDPLSSFLILFFPGKLRLSLITLPGNASAWFV